MNKYFAILTPTTDRLFYAWLATGLLIIYLVLPLYPNFSETGSAVLYIWIQSSVAGGLLFPLLKRWQHCQILRLMPDYNAIMKRLVVALFGLFMLLPALLSLLTGYDNWVVQAIALLLWSGAAFIALRRSDSSEKNDNKLNGSLLPLYYLPAWIGIFNASQSYISWDYLMTVEAYLSIVALSLLIWLIPRQQYREKKPQKKFYFCNVFLFPKSTKLVFGALSSYGFWGVFLFQLVMVLFVASIVYFGEADMFSFAFFLLTFSVIKLLEQKEKLSVLAFMIGGPEHHFGKIIYRSLLNITVFFAILSALLIAIISPFIQVEIPFSMLLFLVLSTACLLYLSLRFSDRAYSWISTAIYLVIVELVRNYLDAFAVINIGLVLLIALSVKYPPLNWLKAEHGINPLIPKL